MTLNDKVQPKGCKQVPMDVTQKIICYDCRNSYIFIEPLEDKVYCSEKEEFLDYLRIKCNLFE